MSISTSNMSLQTSNVSTDIPCLYRHPMSLQTSNVSTDIQYLYRNSMSLQTSNVSTDIQCLNWQPVSLQTSNVFGNLEMFAFSIVSRNEFQNISERLFPSFNFANHVQLLILLKMSWICLIRDKKRTNAENVCIFAYGSSQSKE